MFSKIRHRGLRLLALFCAFVAGSMAAVAVDIHVDGSFVGGPGDGTPAAPFLTIQEGVDAAVEGDRVLVASGTYTENVIISGKRVDLIGVEGHGQTVIDGAAAPAPAPVLLLDDVGTAVVAGFTITGGVNKFGGGIELDGGPLAGEPTITRNVIRGNQAIQIFESYYGGDGGGISVFAAPGVVIRNNLITENLAEHQGAGIHVDQSNFAVIAFNTIVGNTSTASTLGYGPGINILEGGGQEIINNLVAYNTSATSPTGGIEVYNASPTLIGNGLYQNSPADFLSTQGPLPPGNAVVDPRFHDPVAKDWHLRLDSPAVDFSSPSVASGALDLDGNPRVLDANGDGSAIPDVGCYEQVGQIPILAMFSTGLISWVAPFEDGDAYHLFRGSRANLLAGDMGPCQDSRDPDITDRFFQEDEVPALGEMFTYVVNFELRSATSSLGLETSGADRDPGTACP